MIDWSKAPDWANYVAMDSDGEWFFYDVKPVKRNGKWRIAEDNTRIETVCFNWTKSLEERPK